MFEISEQFLTLFISIVSFKEVYDLNSSKHHFVKIFLMFTLCIVLSPERTHSSPSTQPLRARVNGA